MKSYHSKKEAKKVLRELRKRFEDMERLSVQQIIKQYFNPQSPFQYLLAEKRTRGWVNYISKGFNREGRMFGRLNDNGGYGFPEGEEEARFIGTKGYVMAKGHIFSAFLKIKNGQRQRLLQAENESVPLLRPVAMLK